MAKESRTVALSRYFHLLDKPDIVRVFELLFSLLKMTDEQPELLMEVSPKYKRTFLHVAVMANSEVQVKKVLDTMLADVDIAPRTISRDDRLFRDLEYLSTVESLSGSTAYQMARVVGHEGIVDMIKRCQKEINNSWKIPAVSLAASSTVVPGEHGAANSQPLLREEQEDDIKQIGEVLKCCLEPVLLSDEPLKIMSLGDEFRLHTSLATGSNSIKRWIRYSKKPLVHKRINGDTKVKEILEGIVSKLAEKQLLLAFLKLQDKAGRHILHYLADFSRIDVDDPEAENTRDLIFDTLMEKLTEIRELDMNVKDSVGRTPLHLAAAQGFQKRVEYFANDKRTDLNATFSMKSSEDEEQHYDIQDISPLILATANNHFDTVKSLCSKTPKGGTITDEKRDLKVNQKIKTQILLLGHYQVRYSVKWTPLQLAAFKGHVETLKNLLENDQVRDFDKQAQDKGGKIMDTLPVLHLAALGGKPHAIKALLKISNEKSSRKIKPYAFDNRRNTALLYALRHSQFEDDSRPWNLVNILQCFQHSTHKTPSKKNSGAIICCLDLLLQTGLDMDQENLDGVTPQIESAMPRDVQNWWYDKIAKELQETNAQNVTNASNAVSVVAALVATASFVGPLQPPLGLSTDIDIENLWLFGYSQVNHVAVDVFLFFDTLSFYLAIASIMLVLIPSLPFQHKGLLVDVKKAQRYLQGAVVLLLASITCLICTFSAAALAIIPDGKWKYKAIIVSTTIFGGFICLLVLVRSWKTLASVDADQKRRDMHNLESFHQYTRSTLKIRNST